MNTLRDLFEMARDTNSVGMLSPENKEKYNMAIEEGLLRESAQPRSITLDEASDEPEEPVVPIPDDAQTVSRDQETGRMTMGPQHPDFAKSIDTDRRAGYGTYRATSGDKEGSLFSLKPSSLRSDYTKKSKYGWIGERTMTDGSDRKVTDLAARGKLMHNGELVSYPLLVPTLTQAELGELLKGGDIPLSVQGKAIDHAKGRLEQGLSPFYAKRLTQYMPLGLTGAALEAGDSDGVINAFVHGFNEGLFVELPEMFFKALEFMTPTSAKKAGFDPGKFLADWIEHKGVEWFGERQYEGLARIIYEGTKMFAPSVLPPMGYFAGGRLLLKLASMQKFVGAAEKAGVVDKALRFAKFRHPGFKGFKDPRIIKGGQAALKAQKSIKAVRDALILHASLVTAVGLYGASTYQRTEDEIYKRMARLKSEGKHAEAAALEGTLWYAPAATGSIEAAGEFFGTRYLAKLFRLDPEKVGALGPRAFVKKWAKDLFKTMGVEVGTEVGQAGGQVGVEKYSNIRPGANVLYEMIDVVGPTIWMTLMTGGLASPTHMRAFANESAEWQARNDEAYKQTKAAKENISGEAGLWERGWYTAMDEGEEQGRYGYVGETTKFMAGEKVSKSQAGSREGYRNNVTGEFIDINDSPATHIKRRKKEITALRAKAKKAKLDTTKEKHNNEIDRLQKEINGLEAHTKLEVEDNKVYRWLSDEEINFGQEGVEGFIIKKAAVLGLQKRIKSSKKRRDSIKKSTLKNKASLGKKLDKVIERLETELGEAKQQRDAFSKLLKENNIKEPTKLSQVMNIISGKKPGRMKVLVYEADNKQLAEEYKETYKASAINHYSSRAKSYARIYTRKDIDNIFNEARKGVVKNDKDIISNLKDMLSLKEAREIQMSLFYQERDLNYFINDIEMEMGPGALSRQAKIRLAKVEQRQQLITATISGLVQKEREGAEAVEGAQGTEPETKTKDEAGTGVTQTEPKTETKTKEVKSTSAVDDEEPAGWWSKPGTHDHNTQVLRAVPFKVLKNAIISIGLEDKLIATNSRNYLIHNILGVPDPGSIYLTKGKTAWEKIDRMVGEEAAAKIKKRTFNDKNVKSLIDFIKADYRMHKDNSKLRDVLGSKKTGERWYYDKNQGGMGGITVDQLIEDTEQIDGGKKPTFMYMKALEETMMHTVSDGKGSNLWDVLYALEAAGEIQDGMAWLEYFRHRGKVLRANNIKGGHTGKLKGDAWNTINNKKNKREEFEDEATIGNTTMTELQNVFRKHTKQTPVFTLKPMKTIAASDTGIMSKEEEKRITALSNRIGSAKSITEWYVSQPRSVKSKYLKDLAVFHQYINMHINSAQGKKDAYQLPLTDDGHTVDWGAISPTDIDFRGLMKEYITSLRMNKGTQGQAKAKGYAMGTVMGMLTPLRSYFEGDKYARKDQELTFNMDTVLDANVLPAVIRNVVPYTKHAASEVWYTRAMANLDEEISTAKEWEQTQIKASKETHGAKGDLWRDDEAVIRARRDLSNTLLKKAVIEVAIDTMGRAVEIVSLEMSDIDFTNGTILYRHTKSSLNRTVNSMGIATGKAIGHPKGSLKEYRDYVESYIQDYSPNHGTLGHSNTNLENSTFLYIKDDNTLKYKESKKKTDMYNYGYEVDNNNLLESFNYDDILKTSKKFFLAVIAKHKEETPGFNADDHSITPHGFRHLGAHILLRHKIPEDTVRGWLGHQGDNIVKNYMRSVAMEALKTKDEVWLGVYANKIAEFKVKDSEDKIIAFTSDESQRIKRSSHAFTELKRPGAKVADQKVFGYLFLKGAKITKEKIRGLDNIAFINTKTPGGKTEVKVFIPHEDGDFIVSIKHADEMLKDDTTGRGVDLQLAANEFRAQKETPLNEEAETQNVSYSTGDKQTIIADKIKQAANNDDFEGVVDGLDHIEKTGEKPAQLPMSQALEIVTDMIMRHPENTRGTHKGVLEWMDVVKRIVKMRPALKAEANKALGIKTPKKAVTKKATGKKKTTGKKKVTRRRQNVAELVEIKGKGVFTSKEQAQRVIDGVSSLPGHVGMDKNITIINRVDEYGPELNPLKNEADMSILLAQGGFKDAKAVERAIREGQRFFITGLYEVGEGVGGKQGQKTITLFHGSTLRTITEEYAHGFILEGGKPKGLTGGVRIGHLYEEERAAKYLAKEWEKAIRAGRIKDVKNSISVPASGKTVGNGVNAPGIIRRHLVERLDKLPGTYSKEIEDVLGSIEGGLLSKEEQEYMIENAESQAMVELSLRKARTTMNRADIKRLERELYDLTGERHTWAYKLMAGLGERYWRVKWTLEFWLPMSTITNRNYIITQRMFAQGIIGQTEELALKFEERLKVIPVENHHDIFHYIDSSGRFHNEYQINFMAHYNIYKKGLQKLEEVENEIEKLETFIENATDQSSIDLHNENIKKLREEKEGLASREKLKRTLDINHQETLEKFEKVDNDNLRKINPKYREFASGIKKLQLTLGQKLLDVGAISHDTFWTMHGKYIHYMYLVNMLPHSDKYLKYLDQVGVEGVLETGFLEQKDPGLAIEIKEGMGIIKDTSQIIPKGIGMTLGYIAKHNYFAKIADPKMGVVLPEIEGVEWHKDKGHVIKEVIEDPGQWDKVVRNYPEFHEIERAEKEGRDIPEFKTISFDRDALTIYHSVWGLNQKISKQKSVVETVSNLKGFDKEKTSDLLSHYEELYKPVKTALDKRNETLSRNYIKMGDVGSKTFGPLSGKLLASPVANDILPLTRYEHEYGTVFSWLIQANEQTTMMFKAGKVALNPPTAIRNVVSNILQNNLRGRPLPLVFSDLFSAVQSLISKDIYYQEAKKIGLFKGNWNVVELGEIQEKFKGKLYKIKDGKPVKKKPYTWFGAMAMIKDLSKYYGKIDELAKLSIYKQLRSKGNLDRFGIGDGTQVSIADAARIANKYGMDYSLADRSIKYLRRQIIPFGTYQYKVLPLIFESMIARPWIMGKWVAFLGVGGFSLAQTMAKFLMDIDDDEWERLMKKLPAFIRLNKTFVPVPWRNKNGEYMWVDGSYFMPWGTWHAIAKDMTELDISQSFNTLGVGNPFLTAFTTLKTWRRDRPPVDPFTKQEIWNNVDPAHIKYLKTFSWLHNLVTPGIFENIFVPGYTERQGWVGRSTAVIKGWITGEPFNDKWNREYGNEQFFRFFGINAQTISPAQTMAITKARLNVLRGDLRKRVRNPSVQGNPDKIKKAIDIYQKKAKKIMDKDPGIFARGKYNR